MPSGAGDARDSSGSSVSARSKLRPSSVGSNRTIRWPYSFSSTSSGSSASTGQLARTLAQSWPKAISAQRTLSVYVSSSPPSPAGTRAPLLSSSRRSSAGERDGEDTGVSDSPEMPVKSTVPSVCIGEPTGEMSMAARFSHAILA